MTMKLLRYIALALAAVTALLPAAAQSDQVQWTTTVETTGPHSGAIV